MTEAQLQAAVIELAETFKWRTYHTHDSRHSAKGFPDLCMVRGNVLMFVELKSEKGKTTSEQDWWLLDLAQAGAVVYVWKPEDWLNGDIERSLR